MLSRKTFIVLVFLFTIKAHAQQMSYEDVLQEAIAHRQTQNAAHVILWNPEHFLLNIDSFFVDQSKGLLTVQSGKFLVKYHIKILGTFDHKDSTFLWSTYNKSIHKNLTSPVINLISVAASNKWQIAKTTKIKCSFDSAYKLATLAFYIDSANGMDNLMTNGRQTNLIFSYYEVEVYDRRSKSLITKIPVKKHYSFVDAPASITHCKNYVTEFAANERKYSQLYEENNKNWKYLDTMFANRIKISDKYWDTTSAHYVFFRKNRLQADLQSMINWRVIEVDGSPYVLYDEREPWGSLKTWAFKMCNGEKKICNEYMCL